MIDIKRTFSIFIFPLIGSELKISTLNHITFLLGGTVLQDLVPSVMYVVIKHFVFLVFAKAFGWYKTSFTSTRLPVPIPVPVQPVHIPLSVPAPVPNGERLFPPHSMVARFGPAVLDTVNHCELSPTHHWSK